MTALWIVLPLAILLAAIGVWAFIWSVRSGQMDDLDTPALRPLVDDDNPSGPASTPVKHDSENLGI